MATLKIYYQNVRGLRTKTNIVLRGVCLSSYDIVIFTETWLDDSFNNSELFDGRYLVWRRDRDYSRTGQKRGGGVLIAVKHELTIVERLDWRSSAEDIWLSVILKRSKPQIFVYDLNVDKYRPICVQAVVSKKTKKLTRIDFNVKLPVIVCGDTKGTCHVLKLSPNLRVMCKPPKKAQGIDQRTLQIMKLDKLLSLVRDPPFQTGVVDEKFEDD